jgi:hypothetical protein
MQICDIIWNLSNGRFQKWDALSRAKLRARFVTGKVLSRRVLGDDVSRERQENMGR